jgi:hypothetical protein
MNHKRSGGFAVHLLVLIVLLAAAIGISGWYVYHRSHENQADKQLSEADYVPGVLDVTFKDGTTARQALDLVDSYKLTVEHPEAADAAFTPKSYRAIKDGQFTTIQNKLIKYPEVVSFFDDSADPTSRAGNGEKWVGVIWRQDAKYDRIKTILVESGLGAPTQPQGITRSLYIEVPIGQEKHYIDILKRNPLVKSAERLGKPVLQGGL